MISLKLDVSKIDKTRLFQGEKGTYLDAVLIETPNNQYGDDYMIVESVSKEEREAGTRGVILGNARIIVKGGGQPQENKIAEPGSKDFKGDINSLPF